MTTYTAEDFANVEFARNPNGDELATRCGEYAPQWRTSYNRWLSDVEMADRSWVPVREAAAQPITLDALQAAWEDAEDALEYKAGDEAIIRFTAGDLGVVRLSTDQVDTTGRFRLLHRAPKPKREPWQDLADALRAHTGEPDPEETAKMLYEHGFRKTEEEE